MGEASFDKYSTLVLFRELYRHMLTIGWTSLSDVDSNIENSSFYATYKLALGEWGCLEMETSHNAIGGHAFVVLNKMNGAYLLLELS